MSLRDAVFVKGHAGGFLIFGAQAIDQFVGDGGNLAGLRARHFEAGGGRIGIDRVTGVGVNGDEHIAAETVQAAVELLQQINPHTARAQDARPRAWRFPDWFAVR